jgi:hypothetical protein
MACRPVPGQGAHVCALLLLLLLALLAPPVHATQVVRLDTPALVRGSSDIVIGTVENSVSRWNAGHTRIVTDVTVRVDESLKGGGTSRLTLTQMGGDVDGLHLEVDGSPAFRAGQQSVFFVWRDSHGRAQVNGLAQGKFDIERDAASGRASVHRDLGELALRDPRTARLMRANAADGRVNLDDFKAEIRRAIAAPAQPSGK